MNTTAIISTSTTSTATNGTPSRPNSHQNNTEAETTVTTTTQPFILLAPSPTTVTHSSIFSPPLTIIETDYITAVGLCGVNGYEAEVNHTIGLCREARTDFNLLLTVAKVKTRSYTLRKRNRLMYACLTGNVRWFRTLFRMTGRIDIVNLRTSKNESLYHLVCRLPERWNTRNKVPERIQILDTLFTTNIDINVKTNSTRQTAFDIVATDYEAFVTDDKLQLIFWWLDHIDRLDVENLNRCLPWLAYDNRLETVERLCRMESMDLNIGTSNGYTALIMAVIQGHTSIVDELLRYYPYRLTNLNHQDKEGYTALHLACENYYRDDKYLDTVHSLCQQKDVDLNLPHQNGDTALVIAVSEGHASIVDELLTYYPHRLSSINHKNKEGFTALSIACGKNYTPIVDALRKHDQKSYRVRTVNSSGDKEIYIFIYIRLRCISV